MNKFRVTLVALAAVAISLCGLFGVFALSTGAAPTLLNFAAEHPVALQGGTLLLLLITTAALLLAKRRPRT
jgi:hypothetical protein